MKSSMESLRCQSFKNFEVVCVDDASTDSSKEILKTFIENDPRFTLISCQVNGGVSKARNIGIENAKGEWILFVDADDRIRLDTLQVLADAINHNKNCDLFLFNGFFVNSLGETVADFYSEQVIPNMPEYKAFKVKDYYFVLHYVNAALVCVSREFLSKNKITFTLSMRHEDWDFMWKLFSFNPVIFYLPDKLYHYVIAPDGYTVSQKTTFQCLDLFKAFRNGKSYLSRLGVDESLSFSMNMVAIRHFWDFMVIKIAKVRDLSLRREFMSNFHSFLMSISHEQFNQIRTSPNLLANNKALMKIRRYSSNLILLMVLNSTRQDMVLRKVEVKGSLTFLFLPIKQVAIWLFTPFKIMKILLRYLYEQIKAIV